MKIETDAEFQPKWRYSCFTGGEKEGEHFEKEKADNVEYTPIPYEAHLLMRLSLLYENRAQNVSPGGPKPPSLIFLPEYLGCHCLAAAAKITGFLHRITFYYIDRLHTYTFGK